MRSSWLLGLLLACGSVGCAEAPASAPAKVSSKHFAIVGGTPDTTHAAVVALISLQMDTLCSGTIIAADTSYGWVLTAGHCVAGSDPAAYIVVGNDFNNPTQVFQADEYAIHPKYAVATPDTPSPYDFGLIRFPTGGSTAPAALPAMTPEQDSGGTVLAVGTSVEFVGYGAVDAADQVDDMNSVRNEVAGALSEVDTASVQYGQTTGGPCVGDSGGPAIVDLSGVELLAAVTSYGDSGCTMYGVSGRVSAVYDDFIAPALAGMPIGLYTPPAGCGSAGAGGSGGSSSVGVSDTCTACEKTAESGACVSAVNACHADADCTAFESCASACAATDNVCYNACVFGHPEGAQVDHQFVDCLCQTGCPSECATECSNGTCGFQYGSGAEACGSCVQTSCCAESSACADDAVCIACLTGDSTDPSCLTNAATTAFENCLNQKCETPCSAPSGDGSDCGSAGSSTGSTGTGAANGTDNPASVGTTSSSSGCAIEGRGDGGALAGIAAMLGVLAARRRRRAD